MVFLETMKAGPGTSLLYGRQKKFYYDYAGKILQSAITGEELAIPEGSTFESETLDAFGLTGAKLPTVDKMRIQEFLDATKNLDK